MGPKEFYLSPSIPSGDIDLTQLRAFALAGLRDLPIPNAIYCLKEVILLAHGTGRASGLPRARRCKGLVDSPQDRQLAVNPPISRVKFNCYGECYFQQELRVPHSGRVPMVFAS